MSQSQTIIAIDQLKKIVGQYKNDVKGMTDEELLSQENEAQDKIDEETAWVEALQAERKLRVIRRTAANE